jgi:hypothetical protein
MLEGHWTAEGRLREWYEIGDNNKRLDQTVGISEEGTAKKLRCAIKINLSVITCMNLDMVLSLRVITPACLPPNSHIAEIQCFKKSFNPPPR